MNFMLTIKSSQLFLLFLALQIVSGVVSVFNEFSGDIVFIISFSLFPIWIASISLCTKFYDSKIKRLIAVVTIAIILSMVAGVIIESSIYVVDYAIGATFTLGWFVVSYISSGVLIKINRELEESPLNRFLYVLLMMIPLPGIFIIQPKVNKYIKKMS